jgi:hypothetical protein
VIILKDKLRRAISSGIKRITRWLLILALSFIALLLLLLILLYIPPFQDVITVQLEKTLSSKFQNNTQIGSVHLNLFGNIIIKDVYLDDPEGKEVLKSEEINLDISIIPIIFREIKVDRISVNGFKSYLEIDPDSSKTNLDFILEAFSKTSLKSKSESGEWEILLNDVFIQKSILSLNILRQLNLVVDIGRLKLLNETSDLSNLDFRIKDIQLEDVTVSLELMNNSFNSETADSIQQIPAKMESYPNVISGIRNIIGSDFNFSLNVNNRFELSCEIPDFDGKNLYFNLLEREIQTSSFNLINSNIKMNLPKFNDTNATAIPRQNLSENLFIKNFNWNISSKNIEFENGSVTYDDHTFPDTVHTIYPSHVHLSKIHASLPEVLLANQHFALQCKKLGFTDAKGFDLREFSGNMIYLDDSLSLDRIQIGTGHSTLKAGLQVYGYRLENIYTHPERIKFDLKIDECLVNAKDLDYFMNDNFLTEHDIDNINLRVIADGNLADINLDKLEFLLDDGISARINGQLKNLLKPEIICLGDVRTELNIKTNFLLEAVDSLKNLEIILPDELIINSEIDGCYNNLNIKALLQSSMGDILLNAAYSKPGPDSEDLLNLVMNVNDLELGRILMLDSLGKINFRNESTLKGLKSGPGSFEANIIVDSVYFNQHIIKNLQLASTYDDNNFDITLESKDSLMYFHLDLEGQIIDSLIALNADINLERMDLGRLGLFEEPFQLSARITSEKRISKGCLDGSLELTGLVINSENTFEFDTISMYLHIKKDSMFFELQSEPIQGQYSSNIPFNQLDQRILNFYRHHFVKDDTVLFPERNGKLKFSFFSDKPMENLILLIPGLEDFHFSRIEGELNELNKTSRFALSIPRIAYQDIVIDSITLITESMPEKLNYKINVPDISYQKYGIENLNLYGQTQSGTVKNILVLHGSSEPPLFRAGFTIDHTESGQFVFTINPDSLFINSKLWEVMGDNEIIYDKGKRIFGKIHISDGEESLLALASDTLYKMNIANFHIANLSGFMQSFNPSFDASGMLNMELDANLRKDGLQINTLISISDFAFQQTHFGDVGIRAGNDSDNIILCQLDLVNGENNLLVTGKYDLKEKNNPISAEAHLQLNKLSEFHSFGNSFITDPRGKINGNLSIQGNKDNLNTKGEMVFESLDVLIAPLNNRYRAEKETLLIENNRFRFNDFTLLDSAENRFVVNGFTQFNSFNEINLDLQLKANQFAVYNVAKSADPNLYGKLIISMDAGIKGNIDNPKILADLSVDNGTNMTYALPSKNFDLVDSEGIVEFVNLNDKDTILEIGFQQYISDTLLSKLNWLDLNAVLTIDKTAQFMIDMDPVSGDYIKFGGAGNLNIVVQQNQLPKVTGTYFFEHGIYEVSFYGLVKKTFQFQPGSSISWSGNPYNAMLNMKAIYNIRTASAGLVSREIYGLSDEEKGPYRRSLPYSVGINIDGHLDKPVISFNIDLEEEERRSFPLVESKLNQLNDSGYESELTRQVFGLLTIGSFIPETTGPGNASSYGSALATTAAANSLNSILTNELNKLSGKYIKFADLDIGMQTFSDIESGGQTTRTTMDVRLSKKLFNERVTIEAQGSFDLQNEADKYMHASEESNVHSDFAIIYDLREKGDYKLKAFQRSAYDIIYKNTQMGGVAIIFLMEFDNYRKDRKSKK